MEVPGSRAEEMVFPRAAAGSLLSLSLQTPLSPRQDVRALCPSGCGARQQPSACTHVECCACVVL